MTKIFRAAGIAALTLLLGSSATPLLSRPAPDFEERLQRGLDEDRLDRAHAALYRLFALKAPERLPAEFRADWPEAVVARPQAGAARPWGARCGTTALRGLREGLAELPPAERAEAEALLDLPAAPEGRVERLAGKTVTHALPSWFVTENFSIEWGPNLTNADGTTPARDDNANDVPDVVEQWARYFEASYRAEVVERGYEPAGLATRLIPVYLGNSAPGTTLDNISTGTYAFTFESPLYVLVNNDLTFVPPNEDPEGRIPGAMKVTAAHEFFHVLQFLLPLPAAWNSTTDDWWLEASATWMEDEVFDEVNDYYQYFRGPHGWASLAATGLAVRADSAAYTTKAYGNVIFAKYLSEHVGGARALKALWDLVAAGRRILFDGTPGPGVAAGALDRFAAEAGFAGVGELCLGFAGANATMEYREGAHYGAVPVRPGGLETTADYPDVPFYLGARYLTSSNGTGAGLAVNLLGNPATAWGLAFSVTQPAGHSLVLARESAAGTPSLALAAFEAGATLFAIPSYLTPQLPSLSTPSTPAGYATTAIATAPDTDTPGSVTALSASPAAGGLDVSWGAPETGAPAAGTVVRWRKPADPAYSSRAVFGPVTRIELRGLDEALYDVEVFAYGGAGEEGPATQVTATPAAATPTLTPPITPVEVHVAPAGDGGGGGGGGCFLRALGL